MLLSVTNQPIYTTKTYLNVIIDITQYRHLVHILNP